MFLLTPTDFENTILYNNRISDINIYIREAELKFWYDLCPQFARVLEDLSSGITFKSLINDTRYFVERYRDYMPFFVYNFLVSQGILAAGDIEKETYKKTIYTKGVFGLKRIYDYLNLVIQTHKVLFFNSSIGYCLFDYKYNGYVIPPPLENSEYEDSNGNVYTVTSIVNQTNYFEIYINPIPSDDLFLNSKIYCESKRFIYI